MRYKYEVKSTARSSGILLASAVVILVAIAQAAPKRRNTHLHEVDSLNLSFRQSGPEEVVFSHQTDACDDLDIPDEGAHAFRDATGAVHLIASHYKNLAFIGPDLNHLHRDCKVIYAANGSARPEDFDDMGWIESVYTTDGKTIDGIVSMDYHPNRHHLPCDRSGTSADLCWYSVLTQVDSSDGGRSFHAPPAGKKRFIAGAPYQFDSHHIEVVGALVPTQMVLWNGYVYSLFSMANSRLQKRGDCLVRTQDPGDPASWRAWDGHGFNIRFEDPYPKPPLDPSVHVCLPIGLGSLQAPVRSLLALDNGKGFVAVMLGSYGLGKDRSTTVLASTSSDLVHWSAPVPVITGLAFYQSHRCELTPHAIAYGYPSLLDADSQSFNFNTIGKRGYVYLTRYHYCEGLNRDLVRFPVDIIIR